MIERTERLHAIPIGMKKQAGRTMTEADAYLFAGVTGDRHPVFTDEVAAAAAHLGHRIVPPAYAVGLVSGVLAQFSGQVPAPGVVSYQYDLTVGVPVRYGDTITATVEAVKRDAERFEITLEATCRNQRGEVALHGQTILKVL